MPAHRQNPQRQVARPEARPEAKPSPRNHSHADRSDSTSNRRSQRSWSQERPSGYGHTNDDRGAVEATPRRARSTRSTRPDPTASFSSPSSGGGVRSHQDHSTHQRTPSSERQVTNDRPHDRNSRGRHNSGSTPSNSYQEMYQTSPESGGHGARPSAESLASGWLDSTPKSGGHPRGSSSEPPRASQAHRVKTPDIFVEQYWYEPQDNDSVSAPHWINEK